MANPKPTYSIDGQSVSWNQYRDSLFKNLDDINKRMIESEPFEIVTQANNGFGTKNCRRF